MKPYFFLIFFIIFSVGKGTAQSPEAKLADEVCQTVADADMSKDNKELQSMIMQAVQEAYKVNTDIILEAINNQMENDPALDQQKAAMKVGNNVRVELMDNCETFQRIVMFNGEEVPEISGLVREIGEEISAEIEDVSNKDGIEAVKIEDIAKNVSMSHADELEAEFGMVESEEYAKQLKTYLMTESRPYMRLVVSNKSPLKF